MTEIYAVGEASERGAILQFADGFLKSERSFYDASHRYVDFVRELHTGGYRGKTFLTVSSDVAVLTRPLKGILKGSVKYYSGHRPGDDYSGHRPGDATALAIECGLKIYEELHPDVVIIDVPGQCGIEFLQQLRERETRRCVAAELGRWMQTEEQTEGVKNA